MPFGFGGYGYVVLAVVIGCILALAATIVSFILVIPEKKYAKLPKFFKFLADIFNFKSLLLEKILKFLYVFMTIACIFVGFLMIFWFQNNYFYDKRWNGIIGFVILIGGPILVRLLHEGLMLLILLVKNSTEINEQMKKNAKTCQVENTVTENKGSDSFIDGFNNNL